MFFKLEKPLKLCNEPLMALICTYHSKIIFIILFFDKNSYSNIYLSTQDLIETYFYQIITKAFQPCEIKYLLKTPGCYSLIPN